ncbi:MAG: hypothetical protein ACI4IF_05685 [Acutalibacteraceae bacterium]
MSISIEKSLEEMELILEEAKSVPLSSKVIVDAEGLTELIADIRLHMPEEITQAKRIAQERRDILDNAQSEAEDIIDKARQRADIMIEEHQITKEAKNAAEDIIGRARAEAEATVSSAKAKAEDMTSKAEKWSEDIRRNASSYVENIIKDTDETLTKNVNDIRRLRQSVKDALVQSGVFDRPNFDD